MSGKIDEPAFLRFVDDVKGDTGPAANAIEEQPLLRASRTALVATARIRCTL